MLGQALVSIGIWSPWRQCKNSRGGVGVGLDELPDHARLRPNLDDLSSATMFLQQWCKPCIQMRLELG
eukprot:12005792-Alexandrium_andersonii.AAC.1